MFEPLKIRILSTRLLLLVLVVAIGASVPLAASPLAPVEPQPTDEWAIRLEVGQDPDRLAADLGGRNAGPVGHLPGLFLFRFEGRAGKLAPEIDRSLSQDVRILWFERQVAGRMGSKTVPTDPDFPDQFHLQNTGQYGLPGNDIRAVPAWEQGYDGSGVLIGIVDGGLDWTHPDLGPHYQAAASYDYNAVSPVVDPLAGGYSGTFLAGLAAAVANNGSCGAGVAPAAKLAAIVLLNGSFTDATMAAGLTHALDHPVDIYTNGWGPQDLPYLLDGPGPLAAAALERGVRDGRNGLGAVYVWAGGNGTSQENSNYDGYANSRYTIGVAGASTTGGGFSEPGANLLVAANYHVGASTDISGPAGQVSGDCYAGSWGTSATTALVSGVVALMLDANPGLSWRDVQYILARSARKSAPDDPGWSVNGAGMPVHENLGFGMVNAGLAVSVAANWTPVGPETEQIYVGEGNVFIPELTWPTLTSIVVPAEDSIICEHVELWFKSSHARWRDLKIVLTSPSGTRSVLSENPDQTYYVADPAYADGWTFMTVRNWGERSAGQWDLRVSDVVFGNTGTIESWELRIHGQDPLTAVATGAANRPNAWLAQNHPNPFNPRTNIQFELAAPSAVLLRIFDARGRVVRTVVDGVLAAGPHRRSWDGRDEHGDSVGSGVYWYRLQANDHTETRRMVLLR